jgi:putative CocE/NonD family hydrolase
MSNKPSDTAISSATVRHNLPCTLRDGTVLRADVYRPRTAGRYPVLLCRTPYDKSSNLYIHDAPVLASFGYIVAVQDCRGRGESDGEFAWTFGFPAMTIEALDGYDSVEWAAGLDGSTGVVGMWGNSYPTGLALRAAGEQPPSLATIFSSGVADRQQNMTFGIFETGRRLQWVYTMAADARKRAGDPFGPHHRDEAGDIWERVLRGKWLWHLPFATIPDDFSSTLKEQFDRYAREVQLDMWDYPAIYDKLEVPIAFTTGWWDRLAHHINNFTGMVASGPAGNRAKHRLVIGPWGHSTDHWSGRLGPRDYGAAGNASYPHKTVRWFDHHIKGMENGSEKDPAVNVFVVNDNEWRGFGAWPVPGTEWTPYFLGSRGAANGQTGDGTLSPKTGGSEPDRYNYDPRDPVMSVMALDSQALPSNQAPLDRRMDILVYRTPPLERDVLAIGPVVCHLWAASDAPDTDFTVKLCEVGADGLAINLSYGIVRARYRFGYDRETLLDAGEPQEYVITMMPVGIRLKKGSRLRLDVASSDFPNFDRNHNTGRDYWTDSELRVARQTVFHDAAMPSRVILPILREG